MTNSQNSTLASFVSSLSGGDGLRVEETLGSGYVRLRVAEAERRQAKHDIRCLEDAAIELLRNARDAGAAHIFVGLAREGDLRTLVVVDDGCGIPAHMHRRVFDARVTSKLDTMSMDRWGVHGRGMALYSIRENALDARVMRSDTGLGTALRVTFDAREMRERADQSTWPSVSRAKGSYEVRGPKNVIRTCVEFALECGPACKVYVGSPSELVSTMRVRMEPSEQATCGLAAQATGARELREGAASLGIDMSERTAHRILAGEIAPLRHVFAIATRTSAATTARQAPAARRIALSEQDRAAFSAELAHAFAGLAEKYYLVPTGNPRIRVADGLLTATFEYVDDD